MRTLGTCVAVALVGLLASLSSVRAADDKLGAPEHFMQRATGAGIAEVRLGELAEKKSSNADVKEFARLMVKDHSAANKQLSSIAVKLVKIPIDLDALKAANAVYERLNKLNGAEFDRAFVAQMVEDHDKAVKLFEAEAKEGKNPDLKTFAEKTLPTLKDHLKHARQLADKLK